ncbi:MAG: TetR/AcrR family transcriptional regulator [Cytophagales bacterium]|nr:TetR/AcrR family transcriptional regulator [Rhizobacter sp.]
MTRTSEASVTTKAPRRTHAERREEAEQRLLEAALNIVARRGSVRMTLAEVGEAAGYSRGLASARFGNKAGLVHALVGHIGRRFGEQLAQGPAIEPGLSAILGNIHVYFSRKGGRWTSTRALLVMMTEGCMEPHAGLRQEVAAYNRQVLAWFEEHLRIGIAKGEIAPATDAAATAVVLLGALRGVMLQWLVDERIKLPAARDQLLQMAEALLRPRR